MRKAREVFLNSTEEGLFAYGEQADFVDGTDSGGTNFAVEEIHFCDRV
jgi:hypothetical protein